jgi:8-oxo-dGTP pyrophosphatase MutT (NUDIX family)
MLEHCFGLAPRQAQAIIGAHLSPRAALGLWVTAAREVFEEVGILFAVNDSGEPFMSDPKRAHRLAEKRRQLLGQSLSFLALLESEGLRCDLSALTHFSYWQTPAQISMRFDTRFFIAVLPGEQTPLATSDEVTHSLWLTPDHAMRMFQGGTLPMIFPTFAALRTLADFETIDSVLREFRATRSDAR